MQTYLALIRGVNVGGKNKVSMAHLRECLEELGFEQVSTYINSGNIILASDKKPAEIGKLIEKALQDNFTLDNGLLKVHVISKTRLKNIVLNKPEGFGETPEMHHSDAIFLINIPDDKAFELFSPREGVDKVWAGKGVIYSQRLSAERTKSRLSKIMGSPLYKSMTIRSWNTTVRLLSLMEKK